MSIISEVKCARCDRKYSGVRSRCPYCGARRIGRGKYSEEADNSRGKMLIGILIMTVLVVAAGILLFTTPPPAAPDDGVLAATPPTNSSSILDDTSNETMDGSQIPTPPLIIDDIDSPTPVEESPTVRSVKIVYGKDRVEKKDFTAKIGIKTPLKVAIEPIGITDDIIWESSNEAVFTVTAIDLTKLDVNVVGISAGTATLTVTVGGVSAKCIVRIKKG